MKNLNKLGVILGTGVMSALIFSVAACGDDDDTTGGSTTGGAKAGASGSATTGGGGVSTGGGAGGAGGKGGTGGTGGGGGGAPSAACSKLCDGADSIVTVCAGEAGIDANLKVKDSCLARCAKETDMAKVTCWQMHTSNFKNEGGMHCLHAGGKSVCMPWPAL